jgi:hypothetical protein
LDENYPKEGRKDISELDVSYQNLSGELDLSTFPVLTVLECSSNQLTSLEVNVLKQLKYLNCDSNQLTQLDVSKNDSLTILSCHSNQLISLELNVLKQLNHLDCGSNQLTQLDVSKNDSLTLLSCSSNQLTQLDLSKNISLTLLYCYSNKLTQLDVSKNDSLTGLYCDSNQLTSLDLSQNLELTNFRFFHNKFQDNFLLTIPTKKLTSLYPEDSDGELLKPFLLSGETIEGANIEMTTKTYSLLLKRLKKELVSHYIAQLILNTKLGLPSEIVYAIFEFSLNNERIFQLYKDKYSFSYSTIKNKDDKLVFNDLSELNNLEELNDQIELELEQKQEAELMEEELLLAQIEEMNL